MDQKNIIKTAKIITELEKRLETLIRVLPKEVNTQYIRQQKDYLNKKCTELLELTNPKRQSVQNKKDSEAFAIADTMRALSKNPTEENLKSMKELYGGLRKEIGIR